jgi:hypothetical protein
MTVDQKTALLGEQLSWLAVDAAGHLVEYSSPSAGQDEPAAEASGLHASPSQWAAIHRLGLVNHLVETWREGRGEPLPRDAAQSVYREVLRAEALGLDGRDVQVFVLTALALRRGFEKDGHASSGRRWHACLHDDGRLPALRPP